MHSLVLQLLMAGKNRHVEPLKFYFLQVQGEHEYSGRHRIYYVRIQPAHYNRTRSTSPLSVPMRHLSYAIHGTSCMAPTDFSNLRCRLELLEDRRDHATNDCEPLFATWHLFGTPSLWSISTSSTFTGMRLSSRLCGARYEGSDHTRNSRISIC